MKLIDGGPFDGTFRIGPKAEDFLPCPVEHPNYQELMRLQEVRPVVQWAFLMADTEEGGYHATAPLPIPEKGKQLAFSYKGRVVRVAGTEERFDAAFSEEMELRIKEFVLLQARDLEQLRDSVRALERLQDPKRYGRTPIPQAVKMAVFARDKGRCVQCGAAQSLQFDHVIPVAKGGSNGEENIQILCQRCNLEKYDRIA